MQQDGLTALMVATNKGYEDEIEALLEGGADVNYTHEVRNLLPVYYKRAVHACLG